MATIKHKGILLLQASSPRLIDPSGAEALVITPTASSITINESSQAQLEAKNTVILTAQCTRPDAVINWTTTQGTLSAATGTTVTLSYTVVPVVDFTNITVTATTQADSKYQPTTLQKSATITKVMPPKTSFLLNLRKSIRFCLQSAISIQLGPWQKLSSFSIYANFHVSQHLHTVEQLLPFFCLQDLLGHRP